MLLLLSVASSVTTLLHVLSPYSSYTGGVHVQYAFHSTYYQIFLLMCKEIISLYISFFMHLTILNKLKTRCLFL